LGSRASGSARELNRFIAKLLDLKELATKKGFERFDVRYKRNAKGEHVVAVIWKEWRRE
jgi:hypothetical protein